MTHIDKMRHICKEYSEKSAQLNALKKECEELKGIIAFETNQETTDYGTWIAQYTARNNAPSVDLKRLEAEAPELFNAIGAYINRTTSKVLKVKAAK